MPGLNGYLDFDGKKADLPADLVQRMLNLQRLGDWLRTDLKSIGRFAAGSVFLDSGNVSSFAAEDAASGKSLYFDGEIYNIDAVLRQYNISGVTDSTAEAVLALYFAYPDWRFLNDIDGAFNLALFEKESSKITLVTDHLGLRPLYFCVQDSFAAFSAEIKSLLTIPGVSRSADETAIREFLMFGAFFNDNTWFSDIRLVDPATVLEIEAGRVTKRRYWQMHEVQKLQPGTDPRDVAEEMGRLFKQAVHDRCLSGDRIGIQLSGGLDSRAIFSAMPEELLPMPCFSFGLKGSAELRIAEMVAERKGCRLDQIHIGPEDDWVADRERFVWTTDGFSSVLHMHASVMAEPFRQRCDAVFDGYMGDSMAGGENIFYQNTEDDFFAYHYCWGGDVSFTGVQPIPYLKEMCARNNLEKEHFISYHTSRRWTQTGPFSLSPFVKIRRPFAAKDFVRFSLSLPDELRGDKKLYKQMLLTHFPDMYESIPYQRYMAPISAGGVRLFTSRAIKALRLRAAEKIIRKLPGCRLHISPIEMVNYAVMMRWPKTRQTIDRLLLREAGPLYDHVSREDVAQIVARHMKGAVNAEEIIARFITVEMYLRRVQSL